MIIKVESFDSRKHCRADFCCGQENLDNYIYKQASQDIKRKVSTVFVLIDAADPKLNILGYYTLSSYTIEIEYLDQSFAKNLPRYPQLPATLLGRLAIDNQQKGKGFGELMLLDALKKTLSASKQIASLAIIAEALDDSAVSFYLKYGFQKFIQNPMKLYLPIKSIEDILK
ncbi:GNAT family N-acetyltransferase [Phormidium tenue]|jgi:predicted GNAT family N-acyltransferase|uniref:GNAT family N-acetyltransferase n=1 Tax=Phormidium tenue FACHB-1050 TaxID=2692857 RepID=A0ABR8CD95_9CYAN|nr:GNAT family N-acetyltransferase [Phormidium tenue]MBD2318566.1 GNAT family N-acetyltransferase [Phormidium tenue FACHB-1050]